MKDFKEIPPTERMVIIAKLYHNIWYDTSRYETILNLIYEWDENPVRDAKFLNQIEHGTESEN
jgi:hypothetical protein